MDTCHWCQFFTFSCIIENSEVEIVNRFSKKLKNNLLNINVLALVANKAMRNYFILVDLDMESKYSQV